MASKYLSKLDSTYMWLFLKYRYKTDDPEVNLRLDSLIEKMYDAPIITHHSFKGQIISCELINRLKEIGRFSEFITDHEAYYSVQTTLRQAQTLGFSPRDIQKWINYHEYKNE
jgi:hypothetical protein